MSFKKISKGKIEYVGLGVALGAAFGAAFGDIAIGVAVGLAIGAGLAASKHPRHVDEGASEDA